MAIRRWVVRPDEVLQLQDGSEMAYVSRSRMAEAFMDAEAITAIAGGAGTWVTFRQSTGVEHEFVTTAAVFEWKDRTDAKAQPERATVLEEISATPEDVEAAVLEPEAGASPGLLPFEHEVAEPEPVVDDAIEDIGGEPVLVGAGVDGEPEEDLSAIPEHLREL